MKKFVLDSTAWSAGMHKVGDFRVAPADLVRAFGSPPLHGDAYKTSGEYRFVSDTGEVFALYDWKETSQYREEEDYAPSPEEFWRLANLVNFSIGGAGSPDDLVIWLQAALAVDTIYKEKG